MTPRKGLILAFIVLLVCGVAYALWQEVVREEAKLRQSLSGVVEVQRDLYVQGLADIVRTDRVALLLVDPKTLEPVALRFESPLVPPQTIRIGQEDAQQGITLSGEYLLIGITDKDGEIFRVSPGEVYGRSPQPIALGSEQVRLVLNEPFRGSLFNEPAAPGARTADPAPGAAAGEGGQQYAISGTVVVSREMLRHVRSTDKLVIMLFDPELRRPVAFQIVPHTLLPHQFSIQIPADARATAKPAYELRVVTDRDGNVFGSSQGEVVGRSGNPIPLGTSGLVFELNQPYQR